MNKNEIKEHIADLKKMMKECMIAKNARGSILAVKGNVIWLDFNSRLFLLNKLSRLFKLIFTKWEKGCSSDCFPHSTTLFQVWAIIFSPSLLLIYFWILEQVPSSSFYIIFEYCSTNPVKYPKRLCVGLRKSNWPVLTPYLLVIF